MRVQLTDDQKAFIQEGRFAHEEDALKEALFILVGSSRAPPC
jgi:hypothetical protein